MRFAALLLATTMTMWVSAQEPNNTSQLIANGIPAEEESVLRYGFGVAKSIPIVIAKEEFVPSNSLLKVCVSTIVDDKVRESLVGWVEEWNSKDSAKRGRIEIAPDSVSADITLVRYMRPDKAWGSVSRGAEKRRIIPAYSYLVTREPNKIKVLWHDVSLSYQGEYEHSAKTLAKQVEKIARRQNRVKNK